MNEHVLKTFNYPFDKPGPSGATHETLNIDPNNNHNINLSPQEHMEVTHNHTQRKIKAHESRKKDINVFVSARSYKNRKEVFTK